MQFSDDPEMFEVAREERRARQTGGRGDQRVRHVDSVSADVTRRQARNTRSHGQRRQQGKQRFDFTHLAPRQGRISQQLSFSDDRNSGLHAPSLNIAQKSGSLRVSAEMIDEDIGIDQKLGQVLPHVFVAGCPALPGSPFVSDAAGNARTEQAGCAGDGRTLQRPRGFRALARPGQNPLHDLKPVFECLHFMKNACIRHAENELIIDDSDCQAGGHRLIR